MSNAVIYARFSCSKQREESIEDQVRVCTAAAQRAGDRIVHVYSDAAISGRTDARPQFQQMLADSSKRLWDVVYVYKSDRFARNRYDSAVNKGKLRKNGVRLVCAAEPIPDGPEGVLLESLYEGMAEYYSANLSENVRRGIEGKALKQMYNGGNLLYGYRVGPDGRYEVDPDESRVVGLVFELYADGSTFREIAEAVAALGPIGRPRKWSNSCIGALVRKEQYRGVYSYAGHRVESGMPRIVDDETWDRAQARIGRRGHNRRADYDVYALSGKLHDAQGRPFVGTAGTSRNGTRYNYYKCLETGQTYPRDDIDARIAAAVSLELAKPGIADEIADMVMDEIDQSEQDAHNAAEAMRKEVASLDRQLDKLLDVVCDKGYDERISRKMDELKARYDEAVAELAEMDRGAPTLTRDMVRFWVMTIADNVDTDTLLDFVTEAMIDDAGAIRVAFILDQTKKTNHQVECGGSHRYTLVGDSERHTNIFAVPGGFAINIAA